MTIKDAVAPSAAAPEGEPITINVAILAALIYEVRPFLRAVSARRRKNFDFPVWEFTTREGRGMVALSGVGEAAACRTAAQLLTACRPQVFLSIGFGGGLTPEVHPGAIIVGNSFWHYSPKSGGMREVAVPPAPHSCADLANRLVATGVPALAGNIVTTPTIIAKARHLAAFQHLRYPVLDLETSAAAEVAASHQVAFLGVRAVTDAAEEEIPDFICRAVESGSTFSPSTVLRWLAARPTAIVHLALLWHRSRTAARQLSRTLKVLLAWL